jgi:hypothetical protein
MGEGFVLDRIENLGDISRFPDKFPVLRYR